MAIIFLSFAIIALSLAGLGLGVIFGRTPIKGSCGGLSCIDKSACVACPHKHGADQ